MEGLRCGGRGSNQSAVHVPSTIFVKTEPSDSSNVARSIYNIACIFSTFYLFGS